MATRAERYQQLARECLKLAKIVPAGHPRDSLIDMAREWGRLADEEVGLSDLYEEE
jgi:hypothetical protein